MRNHGEIAEALSLEGSVSKEKEVHEEIQEDIYYLEHRKVDPYELKIRQEIIDKYIFINGPVINKILKLRLTELYTIFQTEEFKKFKANLPGDQHITPDGYLIYRKSIKNTKEGLPGFEDEIYYEYKYDNPPEDITILFGSNEYCEKIKELQSQIISWEDFCIKYYDTPYIKSEACSNYIKRLFNNYDSNK